MESADYVKQQISRLYHDNVNIEEAVLLIRDWHVSSELVKSIYDQLSKEDDNLMKERFYYYKIARENDSLYRSIYYWTSRYLLVDETVSDNSKFHEIRIFDAFNDKSM
jgi:hypothetical protein